MMEDSASAYSGSPRKPESQMIDYNRRIKQMQQRLLMKEYDDRINRKQLSRYEEELRKQQELEEVRRSQQALQQQNIDIHRKQFQEQGALGSEYQAMIAERNRREQIEKQAKLDIEKNIILRRHQEEILDKLNQKRKADEYRKQIEQDLTQKQVYKSAKEQLEAASERQHILSIAQHARRQLFYEQGQRKYFKQFNEHQNKRLMNNLQSARDSLTQQVTDFDNLKHTRSTDMASNDTQMRYRSSIRKEEQNDYRQGLEIQLMEKDIRRRREKAERFRSVEQPDAKLDSYNPIVNPLPIERKNPNIMRLLLQNDTA